MAGYCEEAFVLKNEPISFFFFFFLMAVGMHGPLQVLIIDHKSIQFSNSWTTALLSNSNPSIFIYRCVFEYLYTRRQLM